MNVVIDGLSVPGGFTWLFDTTSGNVAIFVALALGLVGAWVSE